MTLLQIPLVLGEQAVSPDSVNTFVFVVLKILFVVASGLYVAFSFIIVRQIYTMQKTLVTSFAGKLRLLGYLHLLFAIGLLIVFLLWL